ncbi:MAG: tRNA (adenosine(37)-N6)-dimethylallyltransferase MiaA [Desulfovibrionales bacterium]
MDEKIPILCLAGATGTGKTAFALALAERFNCGIINFDSRQIYKHIPLVTAQPTPEEQAQAPHHLYGFLDLDRRCDAGGYAALAAATISEVRQKGLLPLLVGGTGLYLRALLEGIAPIPDIPPAIRREVTLAWTERGAETMYQRLAQVDPKYASKIHPQDRQRITRALEVHQATGQAFSEWHKKTVSYGSYHSLKIGMDIPLKDLAPRLAVRIDQMIRMGAVQEVVRAWEICPQPNAPAFSGIGCREILEHLHQGLSMEEARTKWLQSTRAYAKRQLTWFRKEKDMHWFRTGEGEMMLETVAAWLGSGP